MNERGEDGSKGLRGAALTPAASAYLHAGRPGLWGWILLLVGAAGGVAWASLAPLDQGVSAPAQVIVTGNRKTIQPLAAGLVSAILVREGDKVRAGQTVVRLDSTQARSQLEAARGQWFVMQAVEARLAAEHADRGDIAFPAALVHEQSDRRAAEAMGLQRQLFQTKRANLAGDLTIFRENMAGVEATLQGLEETKASKIEQQRILKEEIRTQRDLAEQGYLPRNRVFEQERLLAQLSGAISEDIGNIGRNRQSIAEIKARISNRVQEYRKEVETQLSDAQKELHTLASRIDALAYDVANTEIRSPADGIVVGLAIFTLGGVVQSGMTLMDIVPENEPLRIDAQIPTTLIDKVHAGLEVDVRFPAFLQSITPRVPGVVKTVSADALFDANLKQPYFKAQIEVTAEGMKMLKQHQIRPGMPAEAFIRTGERTMMNYLFKPVRDRLRSALTEE